MCQLDHRAVIIISMWGGYPHPQFNYVKYGGIINIVEYVGIYLYQKM